jgi:cysteine desulfurase
VTDPTSTPSAPGRRAYLDAGGASRPHPVALQAWQQAAADGWADPRRLHSEGRRARTLLDAARAAIAEIVGARPEEVHLSGSHTTSLHAAVLATAAGRRRHGSTAVVSPVERAAILHAADLAGLRRAPVEVRATGAVDPASFARALESPGVAVAALQHANGEVGTLQPVAAVHEAARRHGVPLLVDAGASAGHVALDGAWDLLALDPADWGGLPGVGILVVRSAVRWRAVWPEDEDPWFPGGVAIPAAFAAAASLQAVVAERKSLDARRRALVDSIRMRVAREVPDTEVVGDPVSRLPHVVTFSSLYVDGEALVGELDRLGFAVGSGSACTSSSLEPSHVLAAMGVLTHGNVRIALDRDVTEGDVARFLDVLPGAVARVRALLGAEHL